jgi:NADPH-dependent 2,4-dienoyl-CoA reductase/sulfur reductase-like enzyme
VNTIGIVGGSLAGLSAARALRTQGYDGQVVVFGDDQRAPYDRPPLSKAFLAGTSSEADLALLGDEEQLDVDWRTGTRAVALHAARRSVEFADGSEQAVDGLVLATGARPRRPWAEVPAGVHVLRSLDDAIALRSALVPGAKLVVVGAGFIGAEVASTAHRLGVDVTVVEAAPAPLGAALGAEMGAVVAGLHADNGVPLIVGIGVTGLLGTERVTGVQLADGRTLAADVVLLGVGVTPEVEWLAGSGLDVSHGVHCDAFGATALPSVVAVGDCSTWFDPELGVHQRLEHWSAARERAAIAVTTLLSAGTTRSTGRPAYFWSDQYGLRLQVAGSTYGTDTVIVEEGTVADRDFLAVYLRAGTPVAVLALGQSKAFMRWRKQLAARVPAVAPPVSA